MENGSACTDSVQIGRPTARAVGRDRRVWSGVGRRCHARGDTPTRASAATPALASVHNGRRSTPTTPIKHVVVIFDENISFDHYFGTYPKATNTDGTPFTRGPAHAQGQRPDRRSC